MPSPLKLSSRGVSAPPWMSPSLRLKPLTKAAEDKLFLRGQAGDQEALHELVMRQARGVAILASRVGRGQDFEDLFQQGIVGILTTAQSYKPELGARFGGYTLLGAMAKQAAAKVAGQGAVRRPRQPPGTPSVNDVSLDAPLRGDDDGDATLADMVADGAVGPEDECEADELAERRRELFDRCLGQLSERSAEVIRRRHLRATPATLAEVADEMGISRERVRQIEVRAIADLRAQLRRAGVSEKTVWQYIG